MDIADFLRARWTEEGSRAHNALNWLDGEKWTAILPEHEWIARKPDMPLVVRLFVTRQSPQHVIADLAAKAHILALHSAEEGQHPDFCGHDRHELPCPTLRALAQPYQAHPAFDPAWAASGRS